MVWYVIAVVGAAFLLLLGHVSSSLLTPLQLLDEPAVRFMSSELVLARWLFTSLAALVAALVVFRWAYRSVPGKGPLVKGLAFGVPLLFLANDLTLLGPSWGLSPLAYSVLAFCHSGVVVLAIAVLFSFAIGRAQATAVRHAV